MVNGREMKAMVDGRKKKGNGEEWLVGKGS